MTAADGYHGRYLRIDLSSGNAEPQLLETEVRRRFLGGVGLGVQLLLRERAAEADPLAPAASLAFVFSPLVGSPLTTSAKFAVVSKSPLTQRLNDALSSSTFAIAGKKTGNDALVLQGRAARPSVLIIDDDTVRLEPAGDLWGSSCQDAERALAARFGQPFSAAVIGPAGERQVRYASISHDGRHAGRGGSGAVLGAKNIKAVLVRGSRYCGWADAADLARYARRLSQRSLGAATAKYRELGTIANLQALNRLHALPTRNFTQGSIASSAAWDGESLQRSHSRQRAYCAACTIGCEHLYELPAGETESRSVRLEYENLFALGPLCGIDDPEVVLRASRRCDELGIDTISAGGTIAFAMECVERGLLNEPWLQFGDGEALLRAIDLIGSADGIGGLLGLGSRQMALELGGDAMRFAPQVKGLEIPGYEPRALQSMALGFAVGTRGADHNRSGAYEVDFAPDVDRRDLTPEMAVRAAATEDQAALLDSLILCKFIRGALDDVWQESAEMLRLVTGWDVTVAELRETARRIITARKLFNIRAGWTPAEDTLPDRFFAAPLADDPRARLHRSQLDAAVRAYHQCRGWTADGRPPEEQLRSLGLA